MERDSFLAYNLDGKRDLVIPRKRMTSTTYTQKTGYAGLSFKGKVVIRHSRRHAQLPRELNRQVGTHLSLHKGLYGDLRHVSMVPEKPGGLILGLALQTARAVVTPLGTALHSAVMLPGG